MDAGIDDEAAGAEGERLEIAEASDLEIIVEAQLVGKLLGIERPAFRIGVERQHRADQRHPVRIFALPGMAGNRLVHREVGERIFAVQIGRAQVDPEAAGDRSVDRGETDRRGL